MPCILFLEFFLLFWPFPLIRPFQKHAKSFVYNELAKLLYKRCNTAMAIYPAIAVLNRYENCTCGIPGGSKCHLKTRFKRPTAIQYLVELKKAGRPTPLPRNQPSL